MRNDTFTVIPQNMREYQMSVREADAENDLFRVAFEQALKADPGADQFLALDFFVAGWKAAVECLNDDEKPGALPDDFKTALKKQAQCAADFASMVAAKQAGEDA